MSITAWRNEYMVGIKSVDSQHMRLLELANKLIEAQSKEEMLKSVILLNKFTKEHYRDEESLMRNSKYPDYLTHKEEHDLLLIKMDNFYDNVKNDNVNSNEIKGFICMWLLDHVFGKDAEFGKFYDSLDQ